MDFIAASFPAGEMPARQKDFAIFIIWLLYHYFEKNQIYSFKITSTRKK